MDGTSILGSVCVSMAWGRRAGRENFYCFLSRPFRPQGLIRQGRKS